MPQKNLYSFFFIIIIQLPLVLMLYHVFGGREGSAFITRGGRFTMSVLSLGPRAWSLLFPLFSKCKLKISYFEVFHLLLLEDLFCLIEETAVAGTLEVLEVF